MQTKRYSVQPATSVSDILGQHKDVVYIILYALAGAIVCGLIYDVGYGRNFTREHIKLRTDQRGRFPSAASASQNVNALNTACQDDPFASYPPTPDLQTSNRYTYGMCGGPVFLCMISD